MPLAGASEIATAMVEDDAPASGISFYKVRGGDGTRGAPTSRRGGCNAMPCHPGPWGVGVEMLAACAFGVLLYC